MHAFLIDPAARTITRVEMPEPHDFRHIHQFIQADCFDCARINRHGDAIFVDDEGQLKPVGTIQFFEHADYASPLAGRGLVLGCDSEGETVSPRTTLEELQAKVRWMSRPTRKPAPLLTP